MRQAPAASGARRPPPAPRVAVVGAGFAGLAAAQTLKLQGISATVIEAGAEPGGRARTPVVGPGLALEIGATWLHGIGTPETPNPVFAAAVEFGLVPTEPQRAQQLSIAKPPAMALGDLAACQAYPVTGAAPMTVCAACATTVLLQIKSGGSRSSCGPGQASRWEAPTCWPHSWRRPRMQRQLTLWTAGGPALWATKWGRPGARCALLAILILPSWCAALDHTKSTVQYSRPAGSDRAPSDPLTHLFQCPAGEQRVPGRALGAGGLRLAVARVPAACHRRLRRLGPPQRARQRAVRGNGRAPRPHPRRLPGGLWLLKAQPCTAVHVLVRN